jgi:membrane fusion protein (multidrug efflux system)
MNRVNRVDQVNRPESPPSQTVPDDLGFALPTSAKPGPARVIALLLLTAALVTGAFFFGYVPRRDDQAALASSTVTEAESLPVVDVIQPKNGKSTRPISLPATLQPLADTVLYPRANGYVERFDVDIGAHVKEGQLLAVIETPELDSQLEQARAQLLQSEAALGQQRAQREYADTSLTRYERLRPAGIASQQELDQKSAEAKVSAANVTAAEATVEVSRADVRRLTQLKSFARVVAPFNGIITSRTTEKGALVTSGNSTPLFRIADVDIMRAFVQVPQTMATYVHAGSSVEISVREYAGRVFTGKLTRTAGVLDQATRTMNTEIQIENKRNELMSGMYAEAALAVDQPHEVWEVPATALFNDAQGLRVATVDEQDTVHFRTVTLERDAGATLQIASGLTGSERIVKLASASLSEGGKVRLRIAAKP